MRVSTGYKVNTKPTRIHVQVLIYNTKPARNERILTDGSERICGYNYHPYSQVTKRLALFGSSPKSVGERC